MRMLKSTLMRMFGRPRGTLGKLGGIIMARTNAAFARFVISLLDVQPREKVLEVGFGTAPGRWCSRPGRETLKRSRVA